MDITIHRGKQGAVTSVRGRVSPGLVRLFGGKAEDGRHVGGAVCPALIVRG